MIASDADRVVYAMTYGRQIAWRYERGYLEDEAESAALLALAEAGESSDLDEVRRSVARHVNRVFRQFTHYDMGASAFRVLDDRGEVSELTVRRLNWITRAVGTLDPRRRRAFRLRFGIGCRPYTVPEVATAMGIQEETARKTIWVAVQALRQMVEDSPEVA